MLDGTLLAVSGPKMRVAIAGVNDAVEFHLRGGQWFSEEGELVEIQLYSGADGDDLDSPVSFGDCAVGGCVGPNSPQGHASVWVN